VNTQLAHSDRVLPPAWQRRGIPDALWDSSGKEGLGTTRRCSPTAWWSSMSGRHRQRPQEASQGGRWSPPSSRARASSTIRGRQPRRAPLSLRLHNDPLSIAQNDNMVSVTLRGGGPYGPGASESIGSRQYSAWGTGGFYTGAWRPNTAVSSGCSVHGRGRATRRSPDRSSPGRRDTLTTSRNDIDTWSRSACSLRYKTLRIARSSSLKSRIRIFARSCVRIKQAQLVADISDDRNRPNGKEESLAMMNKAHIWSAEEHEANSSVRK
jgi:hypothetical protein